MTDIRLYSEDLNRELSAQQMAELMFHFCKLIFYPAMKLKITNNCRMHIGRVLKSLNRHLNRLSTREISPLLKRPIRKISQITLLCSNFSNPGSLGITMMEIEPKNLINLHPRLALKFLDLFIEESAACLKLKWTHVPALHNLPILCVTQIKRLSRELHDQLRILKYNQDKEYHPIAAVVLRIGETSR